MFKNKYGYPILDREGIKVLCLLTCALAFCIYLIFMLIKLIGLTAFAMIAGVCTLVILSAFVAALDSPVACFCKMVALICFLLFAVGFIIYQTGFLLITIMLIMGLPLLLFILFGSLESSKTANPKPLENMFLDPIYKGLNGNIWTKKD